MNIRKATYRDAPGIKTLLEGLGYASRISHLVSQLDKLFSTADHEIFVYEKNKEVVGFMAVHYLPQLVFEGDIMIISYLSVDVSLKGLSIAEELEQYMAERAKIRKCERIQVHCMDWYSPSHQFYLKQGYREHPKYFIKQLK